MKKRLMVFGLLLALVLTAGGCSNPKRDSTDTHIQEQMENGTLDLSGSD